MEQVLETPRLRLQPLSAADRALYVRLYSDPATMRWIGEARSAGDAERSFRAALAQGASPSPARHFWTMRPRAGGAAIGLLGLDRAAADGPEVGALLDAPHQGLGYATEAIAALATHVFSQPGLESLHTRHDPAHAAAAGLMRRLGFTSAAAAAGPHASRWVLTRGQWRSRPGDKPGPIR